LTKEIKGSGERKYKWEAEIQGPLERKYKLEAEKVSINFFSDLRKRVRSFSFYR
jgi:hypothetical protein